MNFRLVLASVIIAAVSNQVAEAANPNPTIAIAVRFEHPSKLADLKNLRSTLKSFMNGLEWGTTVESVTLIKCGGAKANTMVPQELKDRSAIEETIKKFGTESTSAGATAERLPTIATRTRKEFSSNSTVVIVLAATINASQSALAIEVMNTMDGGADVVVFVNSYQQASNQPFKASYHLKPGGNEKNTSGSSSDVANFTSTLRELVHNLVKKRSSIASTPATPTTPTVLTIRPSTVPPATSSEKPSGKGGYSHAEECYYNAEGRCRSNIVFNQQKDDDAVANSEAKDCNATECENTCDKLGTWTECKAEATCRDTKTRNPNQTVAKTQNCPPKMDYCRSRDDCSSTGGVNEMRGAVGVLLILSVFLCLLLLSTIAYAIMLKKCPSKITGKTAEQVLYGLPSLTSSPHTQLVKGYAAKESKAPTSPKGAPSAAKKGVKGAQSPKSSGSDTSKSTKVSLPSKAPAKKR